MILQTKTNLNCYLCIHQESRQLMVPTKIITMTSKEVEIHSSTVKNISSDQTLLQMCTRRSPISRINLIGHKMQLINLMSNCKISHSLMRLPLAYNLKRHWGTTQTWTLLSKTVITRQLAIRDSL